MSQAVASGLAAPSRFELLERVGEGASSDVWRARLAPSGRAVALKIARDATYATVLAREATTALLAVSPRLPHLMGVGLLGASTGPLSPGMVVENAVADTRSSAASSLRAYLALSWADGTTIAAAIKRFGRDRSNAETRGQLAIAVARDLAEALEDLHAAGLAHGDIKPENLVVAEDGSVSVLDLGLCASLHESELHGGSPRYLARGDADLGDGRARDMLALGVVLSEIASRAVAESADALDAARRAVLAPPLDRICNALLAPNPATRPSAAWVADMARPWTAASSSREERDARRVRATYVRIRRGELEALRPAGLDTAPWLPELADQMRRAHALLGRAPTSASAEPMQPLAPEEIARWLTALAGTGATAWPVATLADTSEAKLADGLVRLARELPPMTWTLADVERAVRDSPRPEARQAVLRARRRRHAVSGKPRPFAPLDVDDAVRLSLEISCRPPNGMALAEIEQRPDAPPALVLAAAEALRLGGEVGRARAMVLRSDIAAMPGAGGVVAEILRRSGDVELARERARSALDAGHDAAGAARAVLARLAVDAGELDAADALCVGPGGAALCEASAMRWLGRGQLEKALRDVERGDALARSAEERARMAALRGYIVHATDPETARSSYAVAVDAAMRAGAVVEEASYRTGEAAAAVDVGDLGAAIRSARRAALLWEHLGKPAMAARALLACAAAYATAGARHDAVRVAREAMARAREGGDRKAEAYAHWAIADVSPPGEGAASAFAAAALLANGSKDDELRGAARVLTHSEDALDAPRRAELDALAREPAVAAAARLDWWASRARILRDAIPGSDRADDVLREIVTLAEARAPLASRGPALGAGVELSLASGRGETAQRLAASLADAARELLRRAPPDLEASVRALDWVRRAAPTSREAMRPEQARDLEAIVRSFEERERLRPLLVRVVDALVLWTGVERGLLLLRSGDGRLVPRAARNLARKDLSQEQLVLSKTLASRALEAGEPVVAVDAAGEMASVHHSVHSLKLRSVLAVPLVARGESLGVVYLDDRVRRGAFGPRELEFTRTIATLAAVAIADARDQTMLRREARRARRASARLGELLSQKEARLEFALRELAGAHPRGTRFAYDDIVGDSDAITKMLAMVDRVTGSEVPVLLMGESGSGKELVARAIHQNGARSGRPFVSENCSAIPEGLVESTLFGHVRGAFTGADRPRAGLFDVADRGTLFLDEVGEMSLAMQAKLLRVLEDGMIKPLGTEKDHRVDVRVIAATHRDLEQMVKAKTFREDLFYRLNIITLRVPPLRERASDIPAIVLHMLKKHAPKKTIRVTKAAMEQLRACPWPGNVRQLENELRRAIVLSDGVIDKEQLSPEIMAHPVGPPQELGLRVRERIDALERDLVKQALSQTSGNQTKAAKLLGLSRFGLQKMMKRLAI